MNAPAQIARPCATWTVKGATLLFHCIHCNCSYTQHYMHACSVWHSTHFQTREKSTFPAELCHHHQQQQWLQVPHLQRASSSCPAKQLWTPFLCLARGKALPSVLKVLNKGHSLTWAGELEEATLMTQLVKSATYTSWGALTNQIEQGFSTETSMMLRGNGRLTPLASSSQSTLERTYPSRKWKKQKAYFALLTHDLIQGITYKYRHLHFFWIRRDSRLLLSMSTRLVAL